MTINTILQTRRTIATTWGAHDEDVLLDIHGTRETTAYIAGETPWSREKAAAKLAKYRAEHDEDGTGKYKIVSTEDGGVIGRAGVSTFDKAVGEYELGYVLKPRYWGKGIATETAAAMIGRFFSLGLSDHLIAFSDPDNATSHRVLAKIGMRNAGSRRIGVTEALVFRIDAHEWKLT